MGLLSQVVSKEELLPRARALAERIAANPSHAVRMTKRSDEREQQREFGVGVGTVRYSAGVLPQDGRSSGGRYGSN